MCLRHCLFRPCPRSFLRWHDDEARVGWKQAALHICDQRGSGGIVMPTITVVVVAVLSQFDIPTTRL
jgi:hypothetical protein